MRRAVLTLAGTLLCAAGVAGCGAEPPAAGPESVAQGADAAELELYASALLMGVARANDATATGPERLRDAAARALAQSQEFYASGCAQRVAGTAPDRLELRLARCVGRLGLREVTGHIAYTFAAAPGGGLAVTMDAIEPLRVGGARLDALHAETVLRYVDQHYTMTVTNAAYTGRGARGAYVHRASTEPLVSTWDGRTCFTFQGAWMVEVGPSAERARALRVAVNGYSRCGPCPVAARDAVVVTDEEAMSSLSLTFLGGSFARWTSTRPAGSGTVMLGCAN